MTNENGKLLNKLHLLNLFSLFLLIRLSNFESGTITFEKSIFQEKISRTPLAR